MLNLQFESMIARCSAKTPIVCIHGRPIFINVITLGKNFHPYPWYRPSQAYAVEINDSKVSDGEGEFCSRYGPDFASTFLRLGRPSKLM